MIWWTLLIAMVAFNLGVWLRVHLIRASIMNELVSVEITRQKAAEMIEKTRNVTCVDYRPEGNLE